MPYLDAGVAVGLAYAAATANGYAVCYCNPNVRAENQNFFRERFGTEIFCGAVAIGSKA